LIYGGREETGFQGVVTGAGEATVAASEDAAAGGSVPGEWPGVCAARLTTNTADEMNPAAVRQRIGRGYLEDKDFLAVADFMAALPPFCLVMRARALRPTGGAL